MCVTIRNSLHGVLLLPSLKKRENLFKDLLYKRTRVFSTITLLVKFVICSVFCSKFTVSINPWKSLNSKIIEIHKRFFIFPTLFFELLQSYCSSKHDFVTYFIFLALFELSQSMLLEQINLTSTTWKLNYIGLNPPIYFNWTFILFTSKRKLWKPNLSPEKCNLSLIPRNVQHWLNLPLSSCLVFALVSRAWLCSYYVTQCHKYVRIMHTNRL